MTTALLLSTSSSFLFRSCILVKHAGHERIVFCVFRSSILFFNSVRVQVMERLTTVFNTEQEEFHSQKLNVSLVHEIDKDILTTNISCICFCSNKSVSRVKREEILSCLFFYYSFILKIFLLCISSLFLPNDALHVICE